MLFDLFLFINMSILVLKAPCKHFFQYFKNILSIRVVADIDFDYASTMYISS